MKTCKDCLHARWERTFGGVLSRSGRGECSVEVKLPPLPAAMRWLGGCPPQLVRLPINRKTLLADHCPYWALGAQR